MTFVRRMINVTIALGTGSFTSSTGASGDTQKLSGHRCRATITKPGSTSMGGLQLRVEAVELPTLNKLTNIAVIAGTYQPNVISVEAGDATAGMSLVFKGNMAPQVGSCYADFQGAPESGLVINAWTGIEAQMKPIPPTSYKGSAAVASIMQGLATAANLSFENSGVTAQLSSPYLPGTALDQIRSVAKAADINYALDNGVLAIWPKGGSRPGTTQVISADTGMVGYPVFSAVGLTLTTLFNPSITYGTKVQVKSQLTVASGTWEVFAMSHDISSETPGGPWFTRMEVRQVFSQ